jgi:P-type Cu2+ transporter
MNESAHRHHGPEAAGLGRADQATQTEIATAAVHGHTRVEEGGHAHAGGHDHAAMIADFRRRFWVTLGLTVPILALSPMIQMWLGIGDALAFPGSEYVLFVLSSVVFFYGGAPFLRGLLSEVRARQPAMMTLISVAISAAYIYSTAVVFGLEGETFYWELATLVAIMLLGHWIEMKSVLGASGALEALVRLLPATATRIEADGSHTELPVSELAIGDRVLVRPGDKVPIDGLIVKGRSSFDESMLTGESRPVDKGEGAEAVGGSINGDGAVTIEVRKTGDQTYLSQVIEMVREAQATRSRAQDIANRAAQWLTWVAIIGGGSTLAAWTAAGASFDFALTRMVTVMVIACPHALGLAVPLVVAVSTKLTAQNGLLVRDRAAFERARNLDAVIFDKTGTLTEGRFGVSDVIPLGGGDPDEVLAIAAALESQSEHPIAKGVVRGAQERGLRPKEASDFRNILGRGAEAVVDGRPVKVVSPGYVREAGLWIDHPDLERVGGEGKTTVFVLADGKLVGAIALADVIRPESAATVARLKELGIRSMMLTGDAEAVARSVSREIGLDDYFAEVLPNEKAEKVKEVQARGLSVAMVGDGVNDAPALVQSDLGIAVGAGTDVAIESADVVLVRSNPQDVFAILALSRATYRKMVQNLLWATGYNAVAIPLAAGVAYAWGVLLSPAIGAALMSLSTVIVAINAKLLEGARRKVAQSDEQAPSSKARQEVHHA